MDDLFVKQRMLLNQQLTKFAYRYERFLRHGKLARTFILLWLPIQLALWLLGTGFGAFALTLLLLAAGTLGYVYSDDIRKSWPLGADDFLKYPDVVLFYKVSLVFGFLYLIRKYVVESGLAKKEEKLVELLRSMPPAGTLYRFGKIYRETLEYVDVALAQLIRDRADGKIDQESFNKEITKNIRVILKSILTLAHAIDGQPRCRYAANIMLYVAADKFEGAAAESVRKRVRFVPQEIDIKLLAGILDLMPELSITTDTPNLDPDNSLEALALPVPKNLHDPHSSRLNALPGAPIAWMTGDEVLIEETATLSKWMHQNCNVTPEACTQANEYFNSKVGQRIKSFFALPITVPDAHPIGVINIHRDKPRLFNGSTERGAQFATLSAPFIHLLVKALDEYAPSGHRGGAMSRVVHFSRL